MPQELSLIAICLAIVAWALVSRRLQSTLLTLPMVFAGVGYLIGSDGLGLLQLTLDDGELLKLFAEFTLVLVLFSDAAGVQLSHLRLAYGVPARMLLIGMPLTIALGTLVVHWAVPEMPWTMAMLLAAILTPTDAALAQSLLANTSVPERVRQSINVESGLNDGLAVPFIMLAATLSAQATGTGFDHGPDQLGRFVALQLLLGPLVGIGVGYLLARALDRAGQAGWVSGPGRAIAALAGAVLIYTLAEKLGGNGFIAAFLGGLTLGNTLRQERDFVFGFMESEGRVLTIFSFIIFGAMLVPLAVQYASVKTVVLALLFLSVIRMLPIWLSLLGTHLSGLEKFALGWFGPRGLASTLFVLLIAEEFNLPGFSDILASVVLAVLLSILIHGMSAKPIVAVFVRQANKAQP